MTRPVDPPADILAWNGRIEVDPGQLEAAAPGFLGASDEVTTALDWVRRWSDTSRVGISDPSAAGAWSRAMQIWGHDLGDLATGLGHVAGLLTSSGQGYRQSDAEASAAYDSAS